MLKPEELREFMPRYRDDIVVKVFEKAVIRAAEKNQTSWRIDALHFLDNPTATENQVKEWVREAINIGYENNKDRESNPVLRALKRFEDNGYKVRFFYAEHQFVDMGFEISWGLE